MQKNPYIRPLIAIIVAFALVIGAASLFHRADQPRSGASRAPAIEDFSVSDGIFYVTASGLARAEIWSVPTGAAVTEASYQKIGDAALATSTEDGIQVWMLPVPAEPFLSAQIFAQGYGLGRGGASADPIRMILPYQGAAEISAALWGTPAEAD